MIERVRFEIVTAIRGLLATSIPVAVAILTLSVAAGVNLAMLDCSARR
jgi:hypothetical protein